MPTNDLTIAIISPVHFKKTPAGHLHSKINNSLFGSRSDQRRMEIMARPEKVIKTSQDERAMHLKHVSIINVSVPLQSAACKIYLGKTIGVSTCYRFQLYLKPKSRLFEKSIKPN